MFDNDNSNQTLINEVNIVDIGGHITMDEDSCFDNVDVLKVHPHPWIEPLAHLHETMAKITAECITGVNVKLCNYATSLLQGVGSNIHHLCLAQVNKSMHLGMVFHQVDDGFENSINQMKDWHETMMEHLDTHKKRIKE